MGTFGAIPWILQYIGLCIQLNAAVLVGHDDADNHVYGNAVFTEVPHDMTTQSGKDVEMACSFRGAGSPSYSLEIQWWYIKDYTGGQESPASATNNVAPLDETRKGATKISVVKVFGSNISHKLRLSSVKSSDEGTYECRVIDFSGAEAQQHRVGAFLHVEQHPGSVQQADQQHLHDSADRRLKRRLSGTDCDQGCLL
ncbi:V-set and transmembrane domain-containing protein 2-like protein [Synchiropus picturatus]